MATLTPDHVAQHVAQIDRDKRRRKNMDGKGGIADGQYCKMLQSILICYAPDEDVEMHVVRQAMSQ